MSRNNTFHFLRYFYHHQHVLFSFYLIIFAILEKPFAGYSENIYCVDTVKLNLCWNRKEIQIFNFFSQILYIYHIIEFLEVIRMLNVKSENLILCKLFIAIHILLFNLPMKKDFKHMHRMAKR